MLAASSTILLLDLVNCLCVDQCQGRVAAKTDDQVEIFFNEPFMGYNIGFEKECFNNDSGGERIVDDDDEK